MDIGLKLAELEKRLKAVERSSRLSSASLDDTSLLVKDSTGSLRGIMGQQGDGTTAVNIVNGGPPPAPATPTAAPALGGVSAGWDGTFADGAIIPLDWARVEVHASPTAVFTPTADTLQATIETAQGGIVYIPSTVPLYVAFLARNTSGAASPATAEVGPYAPKPVAGEIGIGEITETLLADDSVTTPKVFANAVTTAKLAAGAVDATSLKADAITGKIITGGTINGAEFHSDNGTGGLVDIADGTVAATASNGWKIVIDPGNEFPVVGFLDNAGAEMAAVNATGVSGRAGLNLSSGPLADGSITDWRWVTTMRDSDTTAGGYWQAARLRDADSAVSNGGLIKMTNDGAQIGFYDSATDARTMLHVINSSKIILFEDARVQISPPANSSPALYVGASAGHTGYLFRVQLNSTDRFTVSPAGTVTAAGAFSAASASITGTVAAADITVTGTITKDATWSTLSTSANWAGYGAPYGAGRYRRMPDGSIFLRDLIVRTATTTPTNGEIVATLPVGYRPTTIVQQNAWVGGSTGGSLSVNINTNGTITITNFSSGAVTYLSTGIGYLSVNGFQFFTD